VRLALSLQWYRGPSGNTNSPIAGATGFTYTDAGADLEHDLLGADGVCDGHE
jgi:hypothetical protein